MHNKLILTFIEISIAYDFGAIKNYPVLLFHPCSYFQYQGGGNLSLNQKVYTDFHPH